VAWFEEFWTLYPRKVAKAIALKATSAKGRTEAKRAEILEGLRAHLPELQSREVRYVPHASTWLNQERWADAPEHPGPQASGDGRPRDRHQTREEQAQLTCMEIISRRLGDEIQPIGLEDGQYASLDARVLSD
jgi:hypothetical protein